MEVVNYFLGDEAGPQRGGGDVQAAPESTVPAAGTPVRFGTPAGTAAAGRLEDMPVNGRVLDVTA